MSLSAWFWLISIWFLVLMKIFSLKFYYNTPTPFMLKCRYCICNAYYPMVRYLLGENEYFHKIQLPLESQLQSWLVDVRNSFSFPLTPSLMYWEWFDWDQYTNKPNNNQYYSPSYSQVYQQSKSKPHSARL